MYRFDKFGYLHNCYLMENNVTIIKGNNRGVYTKKQTLALLKKKDICKKK